MFWVEWQCFEEPVCPLQTLLDYLEGGQSLDEFLDDFPDRQSRGGNCGAGAG